MKMFVKTGDTVVVLSGNDKGRQGKVLEVSPSEGKVIVEGIHVVTKHVKPRKMGDQGGIVKVEGAIYADKVQVVCPSCKKPTRVAHKAVVADNGKKRSIRVCKHCGEEL